MAKKDSTPKRKASKKTKPGRTKKPKMVKKTMTFYMQEGVEFDKEEALKFFDRAVKKEWLYVILYGALNLLMERDRAEGRKA